MNLKCRTCKRENLSVEEIKVEKRTFVNGNGVCKKCACEYEKSRRFITKANRNPEDYLTCDDCDAIFSKYSVGRKRQLRVDCAFCKSENISRY